MDLYKARMSEFHQTEYLSASYHNAINAIGLFSRL